MMPVEGKLIDKFDVTKGVVHRYTGKRVSLPPEEIHPFVQDSRSIFHTELEKRFTERVGHEEDILTATALDPRYDTVCLCSPVYCTLLTALCLCSHCLLHSVSAATVHCTLSLQPLFTAATAYWTVSAATVYCTLSLQALHSVCSHCLLQPFSAATVYCSLSLQPLHCMSAATVYCSLCSLSLQLLFTAATALCICSHCLLQPLHSVSAATVYCSVNIYCKCVDCSHCSSADSRTFYFLVQMRP